MKRSIGIVLLVAGIALIFYGLNASDSIGSNFSRFFTGTPTNKSLWLLIGGIASTVVGGIMTLRPAR